ncbi:PIN-like domain-containing protein [Nocardioides sp. YIM B13467]|uniref:PIN-like domain-containing protein n=1 Tax=Nocardioides sp. YIM B13467 TaxID=3366294 RepID=UPI00366DED91
MSENRSLRDGFDGWMPQSYQDQEYALTAGLISLDANVLLDLYRFNDAGRDGVLEVLAKLDDRVWVSHQAALEFWRTRISVIDNRNKSTETVLGVLAEQRQKALNGIAAWGRSTFVPDAEEAAIRDVLEKASDRIQALVEEQAEESGKFSHDVTEDSVVQRLLDLLAGKVGAPLPPQEHAEALKESDRRVKEKLPPGYRDAEKETDGNPDGAAGDYLVWHQSLLEAKRRGLPLMIVTSDLKEDWWWRNPKGPQVYGPRGELVEEALRVTGAKCYMLDTRALTKLAKPVLGLELTPEALRSVDRSTDIVESFWSSRAVDELLSRLDAEGAVQADVIRRAAELGGIIEREEIFEMAGYEENRRLSGFSKPVIRITNELVAEGLLAVDALPMLTPVWEGSVAVEYEIPIEVAEMLSGGIDD